MKPPFIYKYQPNYLKDFYIDSELKTLLKTLISMDCLNLIFVGDSGSGKSSLIQSIVNEYYSQIPIEIINQNVLSINNLKDQGISYYRNEVKTFCQTASAIPQKKKILILDDIDFIHEHGQQVFRNYIDKFSNSVHFIASCTNSQKTIESLQSRMNLIKIKHCEKDNLMKIINHICYHEDITISLDAKKFIIKISNNSIRVIINYLEKCKLYNKPITIHNVSNLCTNISFHDFEQFTLLCKSQNHQSQIGQAIQILYNLYNYGFSVMDILDNYFIFIKSTKLLADHEKYQIIPLLCKYITYFYQIHEEPIELALFTNNLIQLFNSTNESAKHQHTNTVI